MADVVGHDHLLDGPIEADAGGVHAGADIYKGFFVDLTYVYAISKDVNFPYRLEDRANTYATLKQQRGNIVATVGVKF